MHTRQLQQYTRPTNYKYTKDNLKLATKHTRQLRMKTSFSWYLGGNHIRIWGLVFQVLTGWSLTRSRNVRSCRERHYVTAEGEERWVGDVVQMSEMRGVSWVLVEKPEGKRLLGRTRRRWEGNIKMDLQEVGCGVMDWIDVAQDRDS